MKLNWPESPETSCNGFSFDFMSKNKPFPFLSKTSVFLLLEIQKSNYNSNQTKILSLQSCNEMRTTKFFIAPTIAPVIQKKHTSISFKAKSFDRKICFFSRTFFLFCFGKRPLHRIWKSFIFNPPIRNTFGIDVLYRKVQVKRREKRLSNWVCYILIPVKTNISPEK